MHAHAELSTYAPPALTYLGTIESLTAGDCGGDEDSDGGLTQSGQIC
jgi:hypothetical protein